MPPKCFRLILIYGVEQYLPIEILNTICKNHIVICVDKYHVNNKYCDIITDDLISSIIDDSEIVAITKEAYNLFLEKNQYIRKIALSKQ
ncbi:hypothetical protein Smar_1343 [Staphylothermus marinus F1]|uniref:Uncharacterized protein n=1 Tax=Staphylothermus marinus (strain ATCC 43588 / DSM 3639 / JCM 9404 / F1) TaxID=399550 RepID=A3DP74_STAMF|nr:hypothetical protein [Staphylothermus marinus]ABN70434.1 hypothetical protein Smar_1343 [Staphylothermus marinus F1]